MDDDGCWMDHVDVGWILLDVGWMILMLDGWMLDDDVG